MREYETTFVVQPEISDEGIASLTERLDQTLEKHESIRLMYDDQGRRRLAYEIQNFQKGRYIGLLYLDSGTVVEDLERILRLDDSILRFLTVQVSDEVKDIEKRKAEAAEIERVRAEKAAERAQREAEEAERAQKEAEAAEKAAAKAAAERAAAAEQSAAESEDTATEGPGSAEGEVAAAAVQGGGDAAAVPVAPPSQESAAENPAANAADDVKGA